MHDLRLYRWEHDTIAQTIDITWQSRDPVRVYATQVCGNQNLGSDGGISSADAELLEDLCVQKDCNVAALVRDETSLLVLSWLIPP